MKRAIYLDYAAATPIASDVRQTMEPYFAERFYNPSATYLAAQAVADDVAAARAKAAHWLGIRPGEIIFTAGGTEANNLAVKGVMETFPGKNIVANVTEHESVLRPAGLYAHKFVGVHEDGLVDLTELQKIIDDNTVLVSVMYANNEIGTVEPLKEIAELLNGIRKERQKKGDKTPLYFHVDACQAANYMDLHVRRLGVDLMTVNGGKIYGPKQSGMLFVKTGIKLCPQILGGGQEQGVRSGTENVPGIIGLAAALNLVQRCRNQEVTRLKTLQKLFFELLAINLPNTIINGSRTKRLPNNIHITLPGYDNERLIMQLDEAGIQCAVGSACSASSEEPSHVLKAIGLSDKEARASLRFTMGQFTTEADIHRTVATLKNCL